MGRITRLFLSMTTQEQNDFLNSDTNEQVNLIERSLERNLERGIDDSEMCTEEIRRRQIKRNILIGGFFLTIFVLAIVLPMI